MSTAQARDLLILDVPEESRAAHARLLAADAAERYTAGGVDVAVGTPAWAGGAGLLRAVEVTQGDIGGPVEHG